MIQSVILFILVCISALLVYRIFRSKDVVLLLKVIILYSWLFWFFMPYVITPSNYHWFDTYLSYHEYVNYYILEAIYWNSAFLVFLCLLKRKKLEPVTIIRFTGSFQTKRGFTNFMLVFSIIISLIYTYGVLTSPMTYLERNDVDNAGYSNPVVAYFSILCLAYVYYTIFYRINKVSSLLKVLLWLIVILDVVGKLLHGSRIILALPLLILLYFYLSTRKKTYAILGLSILGLALILAPIISNTRISGDKIAISSAVVLDDIKDELIIKTNGVYYGASYLNNGGWGEGGFSVTLNTLLSNIPMPNKPIPVSIDGTYETTISRLAGNVRNGSYNAYINVGVAASTFPIWVYGWFGYFLYMIFAGLILWLINYWMKSSCAFPILFSLMFLNFPICSIFKSIEVVLRDFPRYILFYIFFYIIATIFFSSQNYNRRKTLSKISHH